MKVRELSTPAVVMDLDVLQSNLQRMARYCKAHGLYLRPHTKTHKSIEVVRMQLELGAIGLTVAKVGEAEVMVASGAKQILVAHPIVGIDKLRRLASLTQQVEIILAIDNLRAAEELSRTAKDQGCEFGVLVEFDSGSHRCGVETADEAARLGKKIAELPGLRVRGLFTYFGSVWGNELERQQQLQMSRVSVNQAIEAFRGASLSLEIVSAGSTPAAEMSHLVPGITEIRPGTYVYNDLNSLYQGLCTEEQCAVRVITTVVSTAVQGQAIVDAGSKTFSSDRLGAGSGEGFGLIEGGARLTISKLNEEHGFVPTNDQALQVGDVLSVIPNHVCTCINMHDQIYTQRDGEVIGTLRIDARGRVC